MYFTKITLKPIKALLVGLGFLGAIHNANSQDISAVDQQKENWIKYLQVNHSIAEFDRKGRYNIYEGIDHDIFFINDTLQFSLISNHENSSTQIQEIITNKKEGVVTRYVTELHDEDSDGDPDEYAYFVYEEPNLPNNFDRAKYSFQFKKGWTNFRSQKRQREAAKMYSKTYNHREDRPSAFIDMQHDLSDYDNDGILDKETYKEKELTDTKYREKSTTVVDIAIPYKDLIPYDPYVQGNDVFSLKTDPRINQNFNIDRWISGTASK